MGQYERIVVGVDDTGRRVEGLGHLMGIVRGRQSGADVQELADSALSRQVPDHPAQELPVRRAPATTCGRHSTTRCAAARSGA